MQLRNEDEKNGQEDDVVHEVKPLEPEEWIHSSSMVEILGSDSSHKVRNWIVFVFCEILSSLSFLFMPNSFSVCSFY